MGRPRESRRLSAIAIAVAWCAMLFVDPASLRAQEEATTADRWGALRQLVGHWQGEVDGSLGTGTGLREYELILEDHFLLFRHEFVRPPQEKSPAGDYHREMGVFSFDSEREKIVLREFFVEGYVNRYVCELARQRLVCEAEYVESGPGIDGRLTLEIRSAYEFEEIFELAFPGSETTIEFDIRWTLIPSLR